MSLNKIDDSKRVNIIKYLCFLKFVLDDMSKDNYNKENCLLLLRYVYVSLVDSLQLEGIDID